MGICHGIAGKPGIWHKMFQINFISQKYVAEQLLPRVAEGGSVTFISSYISGVNLLIDHGVSAWWEGNGILGEGPADVF